MKGLLGRYCLLDVHELNGRGLLEKLENRTVSLVIARYEASEQFDRTVSYDLLFDLFLAGAAAEHRCLVAYRLMLWCQQILTDPILQDQIDKR